MLLPSITLVSLSSSLVAANTYAPTTGACPRGLQAIRPAGSVAGRNQSLSISEAVYVAAHRGGPGFAGFVSYSAAVQAAFPKTSTARLPSYVSTSLTSSDASKRPRLAIAASGGGYRASYFTAGSLSALDARNPAAVKAGLGGLLQASDRISALSGGNWMLSSLVTNDFPEPRKMAQGWLAQFGVFVAGTDAQTGVYFTNIISKMALKAAAGFKVTFGDFWALGLAQHFLPGSTVANFFDTSAHGSDITWSSVLSLPSFKSFKQPLPILLYNAKSNGQDDSTIIPGQTTPLTNTVYESTPFETGSWDASLAAFTPTQYLGTKLKGGAVVDKTKCVTGFDSAAFLLGTSSNLFLMYNTTSEDPFFAGLSPMAGLINSTFQAAQPGTSLDTSSYPNPFYGLGNSANGGYLDADETELRLLDGGLDGAVTPYQPLLVPARQVDVIIGFDALADTVDNFATGSSIIATQKRTDIFKGAYPMPKVPKNLSTFTSTGLANRPVFFGCEDASTPLIVMIGNSPPIDGSVPATNTSTDQLSYTDAEATAFLDQTFTTVTRGFPSTAGATSDPLWSACLACAVTERSRARLGRAREGVCVPCFQRYCWDGKEA